MGVVPAWYCGSRHPVDKVPTLRWSHAWHCAATRRDPHTVRSQKCGYNHNNGKSGIMKGRPWMTQLYESNLWINFNEVATPCDPLPTLPR